MTDAFRSLSDDEVRQIGLIIESLDRSTFDFLQLEFGDVKLMIGKGQPPAVAAAPHVAAAPSMASPQPAPVSAPGATAAAAALVATLSAEAGDGQSVDDDIVEIVAPLLGRFYAQPEPGAPAFVSVGSQVTEDTTVALIEVMKTFNAVPANVNGVITKICVQDAQFVEYGEALFHVRPGKSG